MTKKWSGFVLAFLIRYLVWRGSLWIVCQWFNYPPDILKIIEVSSLFGDLAAAFLWANSDRMRFMALKKVFVSFD